MASCTAYELDTSRNDLKFDKRPVRSNAMKSAVVPEVPNTQALLADAPPTNTGWDPDKSRRLFQVAQYNWIILPLLYTATFAVCYYFFDKKNGGSIEIDDSVTWTTASVLYLNPPLVLVVPSLPYEVFSRVGACFPTYSLRLSKKPMKRSFRRLLVCLVTRGDQPEIVRRSVTAARGLCARVDKRLSFHVLTEEINASNFAGIISDQVAVHGVPRSYKPRKAKFKARSLEWFRIHLQLQDDDWVLHVDEETIIDEYCLRTCIDFITKQNDVDFGLGVIHYNGHHYWDNLLSTVGDVSRLLGDWGRIQWQGNWLKQAALGVHGSFILISGAAENAVTWDTDIVTEDYWFCLGALQKGFKFGWIPAIARELSPSSIPDYVKQRKRWFTGMFKLNQLAGNLQLLCFGWNLGVYIYYAYCFATEQWLVPVPRWFYFLYTLEFATGMAYQSIGVLAQDWDASLPLVSMINNQFLVFIFRPLILLVDSYAVFVTLLEPAKGFYVIAKR